MSSRWMILEFKPKSPKTPWQSVAQAGEGAQLLCQMARA